MMEIVIKIPEGLKDVFENRNVTALDVEEMRMAIKNGTPLPKGHGDLITKEQAIDLVEFYQLNPQHFDFVNLIDEIKDEKPIIEADGGREDAEKSL